MRLKKQSTCGNCGRRGCLRQKLHSPGLLSYCADGMMAAKLLFSLLKKELFSKSAFSSDKFHNCDKHLIV
jgi:hypothetical protein